MDTHTYTYKLPVNTDKTFGIVKYPSVSNVVKCTLTSDNKPGDNK